MILEKINSPKDLKLLSLEELNVLSEEIRKALINKLSEHGGHIGPNLGDVEAIVAMHYVFSSPKDKIVFDVSHQSYTHKMLTGRKNAFLNRNQYDDVSGYTNPNESEHDLFEIGHTSTSISLACGLAKERDLKGEKNNVIAFIGDGSLSGGEAYEGLNNASESKSNIIIIVNDNEMSIAENHGGLYDNLRALRESNGKCECNFFKALGFEYYYVANGHNLRDLIGVFKTVKDSRKPVVVHIHTIKGKGLYFAEENKEQWHWGMPFDKNTGKSLFNNDIEDYNELTGKFILEKIKNDKNIVAVTSATPAVFGFNKERRMEAGAQYVDVGIAEEHAVAYISGVAKAGGKPIYPVYSSFIQRTYDQLSQDLCINKSPALIVVFAGSVFGLNDVTHLGLYDMAMMGNIPNLVYLAPTCKEEYFAMLEWGLNQNLYPVAVRVPGNGVIERNQVFDTDYSQLNKFKIDKHGKDVAIIALGGFYQFGEQVYIKLKENGINATLINPRYITGIDEEMLEELKKNHKLVITLEDGILEGGFGEKIASYYGTSDMYVKNYGIKKSFPDRFIASELLKENGIGVDEITKDIFSLIKL